jgi:predicted transglutaminase-like cysteine proteinase
MHNTLFKLSARTALVSVAVTVATALSAAAATTAPPMAFGAAATPPPGYLDFCARRPDQCGLDAARDGQGAPLDPAALSRDLYARYYWPVALPGGAGANDTAAPTSGGAAADERAVAPLPPAEPLPVEAPAPPIVLASDASTTMAGVILMSDSRPQRAYLFSAVYFTSGPLALVPAPGWAPQVQPDMPLTPPLAAPAPDEPAALTADGRLEASKGLLTTLDRVNRRINSAIRYVSDARQYGQTDYWTLPLEAGAPAAGDCKDYVLEKRRALIAAGLPSSALSIAVVETPWDETHAVLLVATSEGELVLDSLSGWIQPWSKTHYRWIKRQAPGQQLAWVQIAAPD